MKKSTKRLIALIILLVVLPLTVVVYADNSSTIVYYADNSECYHRANCTYLISSNPITLSGAVARGLRPCSRCKPPRLDTSKKEDNAAYVQPVYQPHPSGTSSGGSFTVFVVVAVIIFGVMALTRKGGSKAQSQQPRSAPISTSPQQPQPQPSPNPRGPSQPPPSKPGVITCPRCGAKMVLRNGRYGRFYGCSRFPQCRGTRNYTRPS